MLITDDGALDLVAFVAPVHRAEQIAQNEENVGRHGLWPLLRLSWCVNVCGSLCGGRWTLDGLFWQQKEREKGRAEEEQRGSRPLLSDDHVGGRENSPHYKVRGRMKSFLAA